MISEYIQEALNRAKNEIINDEEPFYGEIPELQCVYATGKTLEVCLEQLKEFIEGWMILSLQKHLPIPRII